MDNLSTEHLTTDLKGRSVRGGALIAVSQGTQLLVSLISQVLARLLTPSDFGLVAMVTAVTGLVKLLPTSDSLRRPSRARRLTMIESPPFLDQFRD